MCSVALAFANRRPGAGIVLKYTKPDPMRWDELRYEIEVAEKLHGTDNAIVGVLLDEYERNKRQTSPCHVLADDYVVRGTVVITTVPVDPGCRQNNYCPPSCQVLAMAPEDSEDAKLRQLMSFARASTTGQGARHVRCREHPTNQARQRHFAGLRCADDRCVSWALMQRSAPPDRYLCARCFGYWSARHYADECPSLRIPAWRAMKDRSRPVGLPRSTLEHVDADDVDAVATADFLEEGMHGLTLLRKRTTKSAAVPEALRQGASRPRIFADMSQAAAPLPLQCSWQRRVQDRADGILQAQQLHTTPGAVTMSLGSAPSTGATADKPAAGASARPATNRPAATNPATNQTVPPATGTTAKPAFNIWTDTDNDESSLYD